ncbi:MAG: short-chain dehydrogenase [Mesorhizobium amorphae]|nr:MAG: short-chain dehydrogenase [Mesorhizobium amorphae]
MAALVTGASAGLGEGFARALAAEGHDLVLSARRADRLDVLASELRAKHGVSVHVFPVDLAEADAPHLLMEAVGEAGLVIDTLVNNAGFGARGAVSELPLERQLAEIDVNCRALVALCRLVLPGMIARQEGGILNLASTAAFVPGPWLAVYYASKAFVLSFSQALHEEVRGQGVRVAALCPGPTKSEFASVAGLGDSALFQRFTAEAEDVIRDGLAALDANQAVKVSGWRNRLVAESTRLVPRALLRRTAGRLQKTR